MALVHSLSLCARITLDMHSLNNEGTEGNQQQTRMVHIINQRGQRAVVNAISGDMFKHILVEHLAPRLQEAGLPLSTGATVGNPDRINQDLLKVVRATALKEGLAAEEKRWLRSAEESLSKGSVETEPSEAQEESDEAEDAGGKKPKAVAPSRYLASTVLELCAVTDICGTLMTMKRPGLSLGRKSVVEFGWVVGLPEDGAGQLLTTTEQYFHVKYAVEGREAAAGGETVAGRQAIFHRPASSGIYALIVNVDVYRIGLNDITRQYVVNAVGRQARARALMQALAATLLKPLGAQRNTQNPHIVNCEGVVAVASTSLPAPTVSPLNDNYRQQIEESATVLNRIQSGAVNVRGFDNLADGVGVLADVAGNIEVPGA
jgi:CRISPR-associated protein Cst2